MVRSYWGRCRVGMVVALAMGSAGCQVIRKKEVPPLAAPEATVGLTHYAGTALSGAQATDIANEAIQRAWAVDFRVIAVESSPVDGFESLAAKARLIIASRGGTPVAPSARLTPGLLARSVPADFDLDDLLGDSNRRADLSQQATGVAPGVTTGLRIGVPANREAPILAPTRTAIVLRLARPAEGDGYELSIESDDLIPIQIGDPPPVPEDSYDPPPPPPMKVTTEREMLVVDRVLDGDSQRLLVVVPMSFENNAAKAVVIDLKLQATDVDPAVKSALAEKMTQDLVASADSVRRRAAITTGSAEELALASALSALAEAGEEPRGALAYLAGESGAGLTESVVLVASPTLLQQIARTVSEQSAGLQKRDRANVAWLLDRTTIAAVSAAENDVANPLSPAVYGALASWGGEVGRQLDALKSLVGQSNSSADLQNRLTAENYIYLEDGSPAVRVRAYDWLNQRGLAPAGFDPLARGRERRLALEKANAPADEAADNSPDDPTTAPADDDPTTQPTTQPASTRP